MDTAPLLQRMVRVNSVNPSLASNSPGEPGMVSLLRDRLSGLPLEIHVLEATPGRPTLVATLKGDGGGRSLMFNAHTDTVGVEGMPEPLSGRISEGRLYGRGSYDMKGGLAAAVEAFCALAAGPRLRGDLVLAAVADEEFASLGTEELLRYVHTDAAIVTEPTALDLCVAHKGFAWFEVRVQGRAAHGSRPDLGIDANLEMGRVLGRISELEGRLRSHPGHPLLGRPSLHVATIHGGTAWSTYSAECVLQVERRMLPGESASHAFDELAVVVAPHPARLIFHRPPFETSPATPFALIVQNAIAAERGAAPAITGQTPWFDAALLASAGIETLIVGHDGGGAHAAEEWADLASVNTLTRTLIQIASHWSA